MKNIILQISGYYALFLTSVMLLAPDVFANITGAYPDIKMFIILFCDGLLKILLNLFILFLIFIKMPEYLSKKI